MAKLTGKIALITGGSRGIGRAVAAAFAAEGARVLITARGEKELAAGAGEIEQAGGDVRWRAADLTKPNQVKALFNEVNRTYGSLQILVNNASLLGPRVPIAEYPLSQWEEVIRVNLTALFFVTQEALKFMIPSREGSIINVSSGVGRIGKPRWGAYAASKFAVEGLTQVLAAEVGDYGIRVNAVNPGGTRTAMRAEAYPEEDPSTLPTPEEITGVFLHLASGDSKDVTGRSLDAREWLKRSV